MHFFRLLHRQTKSESDVSTLVTAPVFVPLRPSLPSFDPTRELYALADPIELETQIASLKDERSTLEQDLDDYRTDLFHARTELYSEMLRNARHEQRVMDDFRTIQTLEARHQRFCSLLVDIGIPRPAVDMICQVIQSGHGSPEDIIVDAIKDAANDDNTLLARLKPIIKNERTPEHYQSALNMTLSIRKELKSQKKRSKFWKKLAQDDDRHADTVTPSPSDISSVRQELSSERQDALNALLSRRRTAKCSDNTDGDVFGGHRRESALDTLAGSLASRPRLSIQENLRLSSSFSLSSTSSVSTTYHSYLSGHPRLQRGSTIDTPTISSRLPSSLSTSLRRSFRSSTESVVLGNVNLNVSRSSSIDPALQEEEIEQQADTENAPTSTVTLSQDLVQNTRRTSQGNGHRRMSSTTSRRSAPTRSTRSSFRLSTFSPFRASRATEPSTVPDSDDSRHSAIDAPSFDTPDIMRLSDLAASTDTDTPSTAMTDTDTPASTAITESSQDTPFSDALSLLKCGADTPFSPMDLDSQIPSTPLGLPAACKALVGTAHTTGTRFLEHVECDASVSASESGARPVEGDDHHHHQEHPHAADSGTDTIPVGESKDSLFTTSISSLSASDTPAPTTPATPPSSGTSTSPGARKASFGRSMLPILAKHLRRLSLSGTSPDREGFVDKLRGLRSLSRPRSRSRSKSKSRSRARSGSESESASGSGSPSGSGSDSVSRSSPPSVWRGSPARSESSRSEQLTASPSPSPIKGSGIPVLQRQRRMTIRARRMTVRKG